jgi:16S rRNA (cytidine1402-2'-O)-methyltransferase
MSGALYLVPNLLGAVPPQDVLPVRTLAAARGIAHWVVETPKAARAFLKTLDLPTPIAALDLRVLADATTPADLAALLAPAQAGSPVGMLSDAGCPGVADPGAVLVAAAHAAGIRVVPLVGPSAVLLALMASGLNGQSFAFHGYLPQAAEARVVALRRLETESRSHARTQLFIETPYRNVAMLETLGRTLAPGTRVCVAVDLTLPTESVVTLPAAEWRRRDVALYAKRPAMFALQA